MKKNTFYTLLILLLFSSSIDANSNNKRFVRVISPDKSYEFSLNLEDGLNYHLSWNNQPIISTSKLGFLLENGTVLPGNAIIEKVEEISYNNVWQPLYGEQEIYEDKYNETLIHLSCNSFSGDFALRVRLYNEGLAFRYEISDADELRINRELTSFSYPNDPYVWTSTRAQGDILKLKLSSLDFAGERPLLAEISDTLFTAVGEAALIDFARMRLAVDITENNTLVASLTKEKDQPVIASAKNFKSPWRFVMAGKTPGELLQNNYLVLNLNEPNQLANTSFIKPGKVIREVTLTTDGGLVAIDFAKKHNIEFIEFDAGWYGNEYDDASDATTITVDPKRSPGPLDLQKVIDYGKQQGVGVILYVNRRAMEKQLDEILPLYKSWGVAGVKYGFVNVGSQSWTQWLHEAVRKAAKYDLMVDIHDEYRPTGYSRTYPNLVTQEGIRGDEESPSNDMVINTIFTRMIAGAGDQTNCYFASRVTEEMGSHASQMAKAICIYSPWQFIYWYDRPAGAPGEVGGAGGAFTVIPEIEDLKFYDQLPTVWDSTKVVEGYPGKFASIARKQNDQWFLGALAGTEEYLLNVKLDFLDAGKKYKATVYADDASLNTLTNVSITEMGVTNESVLKREILSQNGLAVIFTPID